MHVIFRLYQSNNTNGHRMSKTASYWIRKIHRWGALVTAAPMILVIVTGMMLQLKKQIAWVQPPTLQGTHSSIVVSWRKILEVASSDPNAGIQTWSDIDRLDIRPNRGLIKIRTKDDWELQIDGASSSGEILSSAYRRSDLIESLHDGSFFSDSAKLTVFLANGLLLFLLWLTGLWLWYLPIYVKRKRKSQKP